MTVNFTTYKNNVLPKLRKSGYINKRTLESLRQEVNPNFFMYDLQNYIGDKLLHEPYDNLAISIDSNKIERTGKITLDAEQYVYKKMQKIDSKVADLVKILSIKDTNPEIIEIKKKIKEEFCVNEMRFDNNYELAQQCYDALKIAKSYNLELPKEILSSRYLPCSMQCRNNGTPTIIISPYDETDAWQMSTQSPLHQIIHEIVHIGQPDMLINRLSKLPTKYTDIAGGISLYAENNYIHEVHAELLTKKILSEISPEEQELLDYLVTLGYKDIQASGFSCLA